MGTIALICRVALAVIFVVSGVAKLLDRDGTRQAVAGSGLPAGLVPAVALLLAPAELVVAALLVFDRFAAAGLVLSLLLLLAFTATVAASLLAGRRPACRCFGRIGSAEISPRTLARNVSLALLAVVALAGHGTDLRSTWAVVAGLGLAVAIIGAEAAAGHRPRTRSDQRSEQAFAVGLPSGGPDRAPNFRLPSLSGADVSLSVLLAAQRPLMLVYLSPGCGPCGQLRPLVQRWHTLYGERVSFAVLANGTMDSNRAAYVDAHVPVLLDDGDTLTALGLTSPASAVLIDAQGRFASPVAAGPRVVRQLLASVLDGRDDALGSANPVDAAASTLDLDSVPHPRAAVSMDADVDETMLVDEATGEAFTLDPIGALVWSVLDGRSTVREIVADLADVFNTAQEVVGEDVLRLVRTLGRAGLLRGVAGSGVGRTPAPARSEA